jgi:hypothetical protein
MGDEHFIDSEFTFWCVTCPDPVCEGYDSYEEYIHGRCETCRGRDLHPIPMSELYDLKRLFYLYKQTNKT